VRWMALGLLIAECLLGLSGPPRPLPLSFAHTFLAYLFFSATVAIALSTSPGWNREPEAVENQLKRFSSRALATAACTAVVAQVLIGAAFRYAVTNVIVHILGAMVVVALSLAAGLGIKGRFPEHPRLQLAADALIGITLLQVTLGAAVLSLQVINPDDPLPVILAISAHVATAALTLGANVALTIEVYRLVRNTVANPGVSSAASPTV
jgi:heme A synthase